MEHYVIVNDWVADYSSDVVIFGVTHSLDEAKEIFNKRVDEEKTFAEENGFKISIDNEVDFCAEGSNYSVAHTRLYIQRV